MSKNIPPSDRVRVMGTIDPDVYTAAAYTSDYVSMAEFENVMAVISAGILGTSATLDAKLVQATDSSGTAVKDITSKAITQLVKATDDDKQAVINCRADELDTANSFNHVAIVMTVGTATSDAGALLLGFDARYEPEADLASVAEIVS